jgi:hypothetical protein
MKRTGKSEKEMRNMKRNDFQQLLSVTITETEQKERLTKMKESSRLKEYATWLESYSLKYGGLNSRWGAPAYLQAVGEKHQVRLMAMARLGLLPVEDETGRWDKTPKEERVCNDCGKELGTVEHFLTGCKEEAGGKRDERLWRNVMVGWVKYSKEEVKTVGKGWRDVARQVSRKWGNKLQSKKHEHEGQEEANHAEEEDFLQGGQRLAWGRSEAVCEDEPTSKEMEKADVEIFTDGSGTNPGTIAEKSGYGIWIMKKEDINGKEATITEIKGPVITKKATNVSWEQRKKRTTQESSQQ